MKVFISGSTGYIGFHVARAFRRAGHQVWGMTRREEKKPMLEQEEIHAVIGNMNEPGSYSEKLQSADVLIHAAADFQADTASLDKKTVETLIGAGKNSRKTPTFIYTSGIWVVGNTDKPVTEKDPLDPIEMVAWRQEVEKKVLESTEVQGIVIRPGCVYGKQAGLTGSWFQSATGEDQFTMIGSGENRWALVHVEDLAGAYLKASLDGFSGEIFNVTDGTAIPLKQHADAIAKAVGYEGEIRFQPLEDARKELGAMAEALAIDQQVDNSKVKTNLGWQPRHSGFHQDVETYLMSWKAFQEK